jgi:hypothetical protein
MHTRCGVDAGDPQLTHGAFLRATVPVCKLQGLINAVLCYRKDLAARTVKTFGAIKCFLPPTVRSYLIL